MFLCRGYVGFDLEQERGGCRGVGPRRGGAAFLTPPGPLVARSPLRLSTAVAASHCCRRLLNSSSFLSPNFGISRRGCCMAHCADAAHAGVGWLASVVCWYSRRALSLVWRSRFVGHRAAAACMQSAAGRRGAPGWLCMCHIEGRRLAAGQLTLRPEPARPRPPAVGRMGAGEVVRRSCTKPMVRGQQQEAMTRPVAACYQLAAWRRRRTSNSAATQAQQSCLLLHRSKQLGQTKPMHVR